MSGGRAVCEAAHVVALALWLGAVVMSGVTAAIIFPAMRDLAPALPGYAGYGGDHWALAAGMIAFRVFFAADVIQFGGAAMALLTFLISAVAMGAGAARVSVFVRASFLLAAIGVLAYHMFMLSPRMNTELRAYWRAAEAGETATAEMHRAAFQADHPTASFVMSTTAVLVLGALGSGVWSIARGGGRESASPRAAAAGEARGSGGAAKLEEPRLASVRMRR